MTTKKKIALAFLIISILIFCYFILNGSILLFRFYPNEPEFECGTKWVSKEPNLSLIVDNDGYISGNLLLENESFDIEFHTKAGRAHFYINNSASEYYEFWLSGNYKLTRKNDIIIRDIEYYCEPIIQPNKEEKLSFLLTKTQSGDG